MSEVSKSKKDNLKSLTSLRCVFFQFQTKKANIENMLFYQQWYAVFSNKNDPQIRLQFGKISSFFRTYLLSDRKNVAHRLR
jgi:hypothetical protein